MTALLTWFRSGGAGPDVGLTEDKYDPGETSMMVWFVASDGHRSVRSLTLREVADALVATGVVAEPDEPSAAHVERAAERLWLNQHADRRGWSAPLNVAWDDLPEGRRRWWRHQARAAWYALHGEDAPDREPEEEDVGSDSEGPLATWHAVTGSAAPDELQRPRKRRRVVKHARKTGDPVTDAGGGDDA